jgi:hypothetical protein
MNANELQHHMDNRPSFLDTCECDGDNMKDVCLPGKCYHIEKCMDFFMPLADAFEADT